MSNILHNATVDTLLERRSIRKFKPKPLSDDIVETLETVAQHAASSQFLNDWSAIRITDPAAKKRLAEIGGQPYIATAPLLYVFVLDEHRNAAIAASKGVETASASSANETTASTNCPHALRPSKTSSQWNNHPAHSLWESQNPTHWKNRDARKHASGVIPPVAGRNPRLQTSKRP